MSPELQALRAAQDLAAATAANQVPDEYRPKIHIAGFVINVFVTEVGGVGVTVKRSDDYDCKDYIDLIVDKQFNFHTFTEYADEYHENNRDCRSRHQS